MGERIETRMAKTIALSEARVTLSEKVALVNEIYALLELASTHLARACLLITEEIETLYGRKIADRLFDITGLGPEGRRIAEYLERFASLSPLKRQQILRAAARATLKELGIQEGKTC